MNQRAHQQLRLQETVEGLPVVAISFYAWALLSKLVDSLGKSWTGYDSSIANAVMIPIIIFVSWYFTAKDDLTHEVLIELDWSHAARSEIRDVKETPDMISRRLILIGSASLLLATIPSQAEAKKFTPEAFAAAQKAGKPILIAVAATWCTTCRAQEPVILGLSTQPKYKDLVIFEVDFDSQKKVVRSLDARRQSTLIAFKGEIEVDRSVGETDPVAIENMVKKALAGV